MAGEPTGWDLRLLAAMPRGQLLRNLVLFARLLRAGGLEETPDRTAEWLRALRQVDLSRRDDVYAASRALLVSRHEDLEWFDLAFALFFRARGPEQLQAVDLGELIKRRTERTPRSLIQQLTAGDHDRPAATPPASAPPLGLPEWSDRELLQHKDFAAATPEELQALKRMLERTALRVAPRLTRRLMVHRRGARPDLRRSLRAALKFGGELVALRRLRRKSKPRPLVLLCDVSGSMEPYARLLLHFAYGISHQPRAHRSTGPVEAFVFGTRLTRITQALRASDPDRALLTATREIRDLGGGTRTGDALHTFNQHWGRRLLGRGAIVLIISDGWDRGDIPLLEREMDRLSRSCHRLIWLNPLLGSPGYQPLTRGMAAALPCVDDFVPAHNLDSLLRLADLLAQLPARPHRSVYKKI